ncbi:MAG: uracil-DNA glycosylase [Candidatus Gastranaerophilales bacterium]|nr:uracil-DNA glycosylase [Candidatus Gastranaerophilales bacterium]
MESIKKDFDILIKNGWLDKEGAKKYLQNKDIINAVNSSTSPKREDIFCALKSVSKENSRCVILGKDPYPNPLHAHGVAFSSKNSATPDSLKNIFKAIDSAYNSNLFQRANNDLTAWLKQGVLLLNTSLTFEKNDDKKVQAQLQKLHAKIWQGFIQEIIDKILTVKHPLVMFLWGNDAHNLVYKSIKNKEFKTTIHSRTPQIVPNSSIMLLMTSHPSPLSVNRGGDFLKTAPNHFLECDKFLSKNKINWTIL